MSQNEELTPQQIASWFERAFGLNNTIVYTVDGRNISAAEIVAYIRKLNERLVKLAAKLADQA